MSFGRLVQDTSDVHLCGVQFMFLATRYICLDFFMDCTKIVELSSSAVEGKAVNVLNMDASTMRWFFGQYISPGIVRELIVSGQCAFFTCGLTLGGYRILGR